MLGGGGGFVSFFVCFSPCFSPQVLCVKKTGIMLCQQFHKRSVVKKKKKMTVTACPQVSKIDINETLRPDLE